MRIRFSMLAFAGIAVIGLAVGCSDGGAPPVETADAGTDPGSPMPGGDSMPGMDMAMPADGGAPDGDIASDPAGAFADIPTDDPSGAGSDDASSAIPDYGSLPTDDGSTTPDGDDSALSAIPGEGTIPEGTGTENGEDSAASAIPNIPTDGGANGQDGTGAGAEATIPGGIPGGVPGENPDPAGGGAAAAIPGGDPAAANIPGGDPAGANPGGDPSGSAPGGGGPQAPPKNSPEYAVFATVMAVVNNNYSEAAKVIDAKADGILASIRKGQLSKEELADAKGKMGRVKPSGKVRSKGSNKEWTLLNDKGQRLTFTMKKKGEGYVVTSLSIRSARR
ncbi:MAG: hypothetical protein CMJ78_15695 [Planctomycetaceae bacterium]|nr:hypothetical protein [Planctomycetaceae bacterium]